MFLIVGLGNPEEKYAGTRHNLGFEVVDALRKKLNAGDWSLEDKFKSEFIKFNYTLNPIHYTLVLARPQTYMNKSGLAVAKLANFFKIKPQNIVIVHDELDLELGHIKIRLGGSAAGHHGVESVIAGLGTDQYVRLRLGIGTQKALSGEHKQISFNAEHFVLEPFMQHESSTIKRMTKRGVLALETLLEKGLEKTQHQFN